MFRNFQARMYLEILKLVLKVQKGSQKNYGYFDVHQDRTTSSIAVEAFKEKYPNKPNSLQIKFASENPIKITLERYKKNRRICYGNGKQAICLNDKGKKEKITCNNKQCKYMQMEECKFTARVYLKLKGLEDDGVWCFVTTNQAGIKFISARIARARRRGIDLTKDWYELYLNPQESTFGMSYIPDIRRINKTDEKRRNEKSSLKTTFLLTKDFY